MILEHIDSPADLRTLTPEQLAELSEEIRGFIVEAVTATGGHLGSNLGVVELTLALHRTFDSPRDVLLWDTGHQAYVHKLVTGRRDAFAQLRQAGGLSGYPNRAESEHDWVENSHASTILSYAHGLASAFETPGDQTGGWSRWWATARSPAAWPTRPSTTSATRASRVVIVLNDNGRSYAPTVSRLSLSLTHLRLNPTYIQARQRIRHLLRELPGVGDLAYSGVHGLTSALREVVTPHTFFEALGHPLRRAHRRARHRRRGAGLGQRRGMAGTDRRPRAHPEGPGLRAGRRGRHPAAPRRQGRWPPAAAGDGRPLRHRARPAPTARVPPSPGDERLGRHRGRRDGRPARDHLHRRLHPVAAPPGRSRPPHRGHHRGHARTDRAAPVPGPLPRPLLRRRHRRAARR